MFISLQIFFLHFRNSYQSVYALGYRAQVCIVSMFISQPKNKALHLINRGRDSISKIFVVDMHVSDCWSFLLNYFCNNEGTY